MTRKQKKDIIRISAAGVLFACGYVWSDTSLRLPLFIAAYIIAGYDTIYEAVMGIIHVQFLDENFLMTIASIGAIYCGEYPEAVAVMLFYKVGEFFEHYAVNSSRKSIADLMDIKAEYATKLVDVSDESGSSSQVTVEMTVEPEELVPGDLILIKPGEKVPVDGIIRTGSSSLDTAALTGESMPQDVIVGDEVTSGTINLTGALHVEVTKPFEDSTVAKVLDLVENASSRKAPVEAFITKFARYYTPIVVCLALLLAVIPPLAGFGHFTDWLYRAMIFLVISCPCALVISVPLSLFAGIGSASREGILVKGSNYLEALASVETFAFDKTGTLTHGRFTVSKVVPAAGIEASKLIEIATAAESLSNHPIAKSIVAYGKDYLASAGSVGTPENYEEISGKGISCIYKGNNVYCGNDKLIRDLDLSVPEESEIGSLVHVAIKLSNDEYRYLGHIVVADTPRENSAETISALKALGIENTIMLTGDKREVAEAVGNSLGLSKVYSELLPGDKVDAIEAAMTGRSTTPSYTSTANAGASATSGITANAGVSTASGKKSRGHLAFVGDGINDAPVLARADVGIAMGAFGSDAAIEAADVVIMADDISKLVTVTKIARKTLRICKENVVFALAVKFAIMALGAVGLASMWAAVFADVGVAVIAILNALRAMRIR